MALVIIADKLNSRYVIIIKKKEYNTFKGKVRIIISVINFLISYVSYSGSCSSDETFLHVAYRTITLCAVPYIITSIATQL